MKFIYDSAPVTFISKVKKVKYLGDYVLRIVFENGHEQAVDFKSFLKNSTHPSIHEYYNERKFLTYKIEEGNINWNDYEMIFPLESLYNGKI